MKYYYWNDGSDSLWSSNLPPGEEFDDGCVNNISKKRAETVERELNKQVNSIPKKIKKAIENNYQFIKLKQT
jgi:hypothetical protein